MLLKTANQVAKPPAAEIVSSHRRRVLRPSDGLSAADSLRFHWPEYAMEAGELAFYMLCACAFATLLQHPASPLRQWISNAALRRALMGLAIGATVIGIVISPWGKQSGGHFNPAITLSFYRLGKVEFWDAIFFVLAQFFGAICGVAIARYVLAGAPGNSAIRCVVTVPGSYGDRVAFIAELAISFVLMTTILVTRIATLWHATLLCLWERCMRSSLAFEAPLSGMSMNPARTFGSAFHADYWHALWIYFLAPRWEC